MIGVRGPEVGHEGDRQAVKGQPRQLPGVAKKSEPEPKCPGEVVKGRRKKHPVIGQHDQHDQVTLW